MQTKEPETLRPGVQHVKKRLDWPLTRADFKAIKEWIIDWIIEKNVDVINEKINVETLRKVLPYVQLNSDDWCTLEVDDFNTKKKAIHSFYDCIVY